MNDDFDNIATFLKSKMNQFSDDQKLFMYGLYKQGTVGDAPECNKKVSVIEKYKHNAWQNNRGMSSETARKKYVSIGKKLIELMKTNSSKSL